MVLKDHDYSELKMDKWDSISKENTPTQRYVAKKSAILKRVAGECDTNIIVLTKGMLAELVNERSEADHDVTIHVTDTKGSKVWQNTKWSCPKTDLLPISPGMWSLLLAVSQEDRFSIASDKSLCQQLQNIQVNDYVWYHEHANPDIKYKAIVKFIGPVPERGPGSYFGLDVEYQEPNEKFMLSAKQYPIQNSVGKMATASNITPLYMKIQGHNRHLNKFEIHKNEMESNVVDENKIAALDSSQTVLEALCKSDDGTNNNYNAEVLLEEKYKDLKLHSSKNNGATWMKCNKNFSADNIAEKNENKKHEKMEKAGDFKVGSNVKVLLNSKVKSGVIQWIGTHAETAPGKLMAFVELDDDHQLGANEYYNDMKCYHRQPHTIFTDIELCSHLDTFPMDDFGTCLRTIDNFSNMESSVISGRVRPITVKDDLKSICGKYRGIQGHHNSCYLDTTLFSMFAFTCVFDSLLFRPPNKMDRSQYEEVQRVLREEIVNPLRKDMFVAANRVMKLRTLLEKLSSVSGLTSEEKDPEEFLTSLVAQILNAEPFLKLSSGQDAYHYQLFVEKDDHLNLPTVQQLLEQSFFTSNVRLKEVPSCFIIQMPRFGKSFKMYPKIQPTLLLDVTDIIENSPRQCTICGKLAEFECKECYGQCDVGLESISFCSSCLEKVHRHERRSNHEPKKLTVPVEFAILKEHCPVPRLYLELSAVVCIETSHYVSFVKCGPGSEAPWCFFDSMADRKGEKNGYNIPEMVPCPDFPYWLSEEGRNYLAESTDDRKLPEHAKRLLCDAYMCMYQSPDVMMYK